ncbi:hypothetical protein AB0O34_32330 [Sphaerisporangium sp. NPDC088356]|uniref:hypothetical protein n=1 Tax=Sphaerisporangium sp. NPDC088356 TaxID=3154871 RepID=UPI00342B2738
MSGAPERALRIGVRELRASVAEALSLIWRSASADVARFLLLTLVSAAAPIATAWLTKLVLDRLTAPHGAVGGWHSD